MKMYKRHAKAISYGAKRKKKNIKYIVIHYTGNSGDTAKANVDYFATTNTRKAGANFFVDRSGNIGKSINMNLIAYSVGGFYNQKDGAGSYYKKCTNANSISIELCDCSTKDPSDQQTKAVKKLLRYIRKYCPNAKTIIRHWDVNGKICPSRMIGKGNEKWKNFKNMIQ